MIDLKIQTITRQKVHYDTDAIVVYFTAAGIDRRNDFYFSGSINIYDTTISKEEIEQTCINTLTNAFKNV